MRMLVAEHCPPLVQSRLAVRPRLGFLGVGWIGRNRLEAIAQSGLAQIAAIADPDRDRALEAQSHCPNAAVMTSLEDLLEVKVEGMVIATPSALHADQAIAALERGIAVFCQKPLGRSALETRRIVEAARTVNRLLGVDLSYRFVAAFRKVCELCRGGQLGRIYAVDLRFHNAYGPDKAWFYDRALAGGGCVMDLGIHLVDLALWALDFPEVQSVTSRLFAGGKPFVDGAEVEDYAVARLDLRNGATVEMACSWKLHAGCEAVISAAFYGTRGAAAVHNVNGSFYDFVAEQFEGTQRLTLAGPPDNWGGRAALDWVRRLGQGARFDSTAEDFVTVAQTLDAIYRCHLPQTGLAA